MDVSIRRAKPDGESAAGLRAFQQPFLLLLVWAVFCLHGAAAWGFSIEHVRFDRTIRLQPEDILQNGSSLGRGAEQVVAQGTLQTTLNDFSQPIDANIGGTLAGGSMTTSIDARPAFRLRLSNSERRDCLGAADFDVAFRVVAPRRDTFVATGSGGGELRVLNLIPVYQGASGGACPRNIDYGYRMDLALDNAIADGDYAAIVEVEVRSLVPGGGIEVAEEALEVRMPGFLLLYHHSRINVNLEAGALAGALGAGSACSGGFCMDLGKRSLAVSTLGAPVAVGIAADAGAFVPVQIITLRNAVGVRATGCAGNRYSTATFQVLNPVGGVQPGNGVLAGIQNQPCGLNLRSGDLSLALDLTQVDPASGRASASLQITVTGL